MTKKPVPNQRTLSGSVSLQGIGLHTGAHVTLTICPAEPNHGYKFQRTDLDGEPIVPATVECVVSTKRSTTIGIGDATITTTEHVLAALYGCEIDNVLIQINGPEVPILDGSALPFVKAIKALGKVEQEAPRKVFRLRENVIFEDAKKELEMMAVPMPGSALRATVMVDYRSPVLGTQHATMRKLGDFETEFAPCRTFVFLKEVAQLARQGLIKGGDVDNAVVLTERSYSDEELEEIAALVGKERLELHAESPGFLNTTPLRFQNEPARHKLLDIIGDIALTGYFIEGHILAARPGHEGNVAFAKILKNHIRKVSGMPNLDTDRPSLLDINDIARLLPHRYPFLLVDRILEINDDSIIGVKNVTMNEPFFQGHFPDNPVMPGVLQVEAMAQVGGIFALNSVDNPEEYTTYFMKIDKVRFKKKVLPGDTIVFHLELLSPIRRGLVNMKGRAYVRGELVSEAEMLAQVAKNV